ncbi:MAG: response regulator [Myxococcota bacterium]|jgi:CheY-like chemotaxis protein|nr:response regulator [Myxococcota bacterium]
MQRILIVEDDSQVRSMLCRTFKYEGFIVEEAENGRVALEVCARLPVDIVITDIFMPEKAGLRLIQDLRAQPDTASIKIIAISGGSALAPQNYLDVARKFGAVRTFSKPVDRTELVNAVRELLGTVQVEASQEA